MFAIIWRDLVHAARRLARARAFTFVCVVSLGIGMAPAIAVPFAARVMTAGISPAAIRTDGLVEVYTTSSGPRPAANNWSYADFQDLRAADTGLDITGWVNGESTLAIDTPAGRETQVVSTKFVAANYFQTFGITLAQGAGFDAASDDPLAVQPAVIVGHAFWQNRLDSNPNVVGTRLPIDGTDYVIVGVAPVLAFDERQIFLPLELHPSLRERTPDAERVRSDRAEEWIHLHGRLKPGVTVAQANAAVGAVTATLAKAHPATNEFKAGAVAQYDPVGVVQRPQFRILQTVAQTLTGLVLLVVCLNVSGMMTVRHAMRERELSVRQAIGASRLQLVRNLLSEAFILAALGGTLAALVLFNVPRLLMSLSDSVPVQLQQALRFDAYMFFICIVFCFIASLACGLFPALRFSRPAIISLLKDDSGVGGVRAGRVHRFTAALQVAIGVPLIVMAGVSLDRIRSTATHDLGFAAEELYAAQLTLEGTTPETAEFRIRQAGDTLLQAGGIVSVTVADGLPLDFRGREDRVALETAADEGPLFRPVHVTRVGDRYLETMGITLLVGRGFVPDDRAGSAPVTVISKTLARELFPGVAEAEAIGKRVTFGAEEESRQTLTIVGVTDDFPTSQMSTERAQLLLPVAQGVPATVFLVARSAAGESPERMTTALENTVRHLTPEAARTISTGDGVRYAPVISGRWLRENSMNDFLTQSLVGATAGGVILTLSALGIYGVVGLMVTTRTREIAVRAALGASRRRLIGMILRDVLKLVTPGIALGLLLTVALVRLNSENMGIQLSQVENLAYIAGAIVAAAVAVLAGLAPARRAASIQPIVAMRAE